MADHQARKYEFKEPVAFMAAEKLDEGNLVFLFAWFNQNNYFCKKKKMERKLTLKALSDVARHIMPKGSHVWLYGSRARGTAHVGSDWDILVLIDKDRIERDDFNKYSYPLMEFGWTFGEDLSPQMYTTKEWNEMMITPYYQNVERDKKLIYES